MKCCSKTGVIVAAALGIGVAALAVTGWGEVVWNRVAKKVAKQVPPEAQLERVKIQIGKIDKDIDSGWAPIATYEREIKELKGDLENKQSKIKSMEKELAAAANELEAKVVKVKYNGRDYSPSEAGRLLNKELTQFTMLKREVVSKEKLLEARQKKLDAAMSRQKEMKGLKEELLTKVAQIEADLEVLKLARAESKLPTGDKSRLDDIKETLRGLEINIGDKMRALELKTQYNREEATTPAPTVENNDKAEFNDEVIRRVRSVIGDEAKAINGDK